MPPRVSDDYRAFYIEHRSHVWPVCHLPSDYFETAEPLVFGGLKSVEACRLLGEGWSEPEPFGVWSDGVISELAVPYRPDQHELRLLLRAHSMGGEAQQVAVSVDGIDAGTFSIPKEDTTISVPLPATSAPRVARLSLQVAGAFRPLHAAEGPDPRLLGIALIELSRR
jgi:hypothetical protein